MSFVMTLYLIRDFEISLQRKNIFEIPMLQVVKFVTIQFSKSTLDVRGLR